MPSLVYSDRLEPLLRTALGVLLPVMFISSVLHIYRIPLFGVNASPFRAALVLFLMGVAYLGSKQFKQLNKRQEIRATFLIVAAVLGINSIDMFFAGSDDVLVKGILVQGVNIVTSIAVAIYLMSEKKVENAISWFINSIWLVLAISVYTLLTGKLPFHEFLLSVFPLRSEIVDLVIIDRGSIRLAGAFYDPNFFGIYLCAIFVFSCYRYFHVQEKKLYLAVCVITALLVLGSGSRTALIGLLISIVLTAFLVNKSQKLMLVILLIVFSHVVGVTHYVTSAMVNAIVDESAHPQGIAAGSGGPPEVADVGVASTRLTQVESIEDRMQYIRAGWETFIDSPLWGEGSFGLQEHGAIHSSAHVVYLSWLAKYGFVGALVLMAYFLAPAVVLLGKKNEISPGHLYLTITFFSAYSIMYLGYDVFPVLEYQYLLFGVFYALSWSVVEANTKRFPQQQNGLDSRRLGTARPCGEGV